MPGLAQRLKNMGDSERIKNLEEIVVDLNKQVQVHHAVIGIYAGMFRSSMTAQVDLHAAVSFLLASNGSSDCKKLLDQLERVMKDWNNAHAKLVKIEAKFQPPPPS